MLFNSVEFLLVFLPIFLTGFYYACREGSRLSPQHWVVAASFCFYAYWDWRYLPLLIVAIVVNHWLGTRLLSMRSRTLLTTGVVFNLCVLGFFKYADFFLDSWGTLTHTPTGALGIILPLAISFTTFEHIAYLVDSYRGQVHRRYALHEYALFISYFPQLIAGPIFHHREMLPQFKSIVPGYRVASDDVSKGLVLIIAGLFKKVVIADNLAAYVNPAFDQVHLLSFYDAWTATLGYTLELYFDFSAYCEIAMGLGLLMGVRLPLNFNSPYKSVDIQDFWRRWHITLGRWLREYVYFSWGGSRHGVPRTVLALFGTFLLGGLWHGASWQFVVWGAMHGLFMVVLTLWRRLGIALPTWLAGTLTFTSVMLAWVMFRADSVADGLSIYQTMFGLNGLTVPIAFSAFPIVGEYVSIAYSSFYNGMELWAMIALLVFTLRARNIHQRLEEFQPTWRPGAALTAGMACVVFYLGAPSTFLYFQF